MKKIYLTLFILFMTVFIQLFILNVFKRDYYTNLLYSKTNLYVYGADAPRGRILDVNGNVLVDNKVVNTVFFHVLDTFTINDLINISYDISSILDFEEASELDQKNFYLARFDSADLITEEEYVLFNERKLSSDDIYNLKLDRIDLNIFDENDKKTAQVYSLILSGFDYEKKIIKKDVDDEEFAKISEANIAGVTTEILYERYYPYGDSLLSIFGTVGPIFEEDIEYYEDLGYNLSDNVGNSFLEREYEHFLKGIKAIYKVNSDGSLKLVNPESSGADIYLSINIDVQIELENIMKKYMTDALSKPNTDFFSDTFAAISDPLTGKIIAISGIKIYELKEEFYFKEITNEILTSSFTVGSVVKGASISVGYNNGLIDIDKEILDSCVKLKFVPEKCSWESLGYIDDVDALKQSSNYYQYLIAIGLTGKSYTHNMILEANEKQFEIYRNTFEEFGLGTFTGIDLPNEQIGNKSDLVSDDLLLNLSIGQYDTYTLLQLLQYINTIANNKNRLSLSLLNEVYKSDELIYVNQNEILNTLSLENQYYGRIVEGLNEVILSGTGYNYIDAKYNPVGKTGTAEAFLDTNNDGKVDTNTFSLSFAGYAPRDNPKYSIAIISPHIAYKEEGDDYIYRVSRYISNDITDFLFENY